MKREALFPTSLWSAQFFDVAMLQYWSDHIIELKAGDPAGLQLTNQGGWHSKLDLLEDPVLLEMFQWIAAQVKIALTDWGWDLSQAKPRFNNSWALVSELGHGHGAHIHPNSLFSGVFYLTAPPGSGAIAFLDPRAGSQLLQLPLTSEAARRELGRERRIPHAGLMLLFPSWLWHEVEVNHCKKSRISISFNIGLSLA